MNTQLAKVISEEGLPIQQKEGVSVVVAEDPQKGLEIVKSLLYRIVDPKTLLVLSGGSTPKNLYKTLAAEAVLNPGAVAMVDERFGEPGHPTSNERMMGETGLLDYLKSKNTAFYPILQTGKTQQEVIISYEDTVRNLLANFPKSIAILGIGDDGHTAGIAPNRQDFINPIFKEGNKHLFVSGFSDSNGPFKDRVTLTFEALERMDLLIILAFGENKKTAFQKMFQEGSLEQIPSRFYTRADISPKTLLITDQKI